MSDTLRDAMAAFAPDLAADYERFVRRQFEGMVRDLGPALQGIYASSRWVRVFQGIRSMLWRDEPSRDYDPHRAPRPYMLRESALNKNARDYGERTALAWYAKTKAKLGDLQGVTVSPPSRGGMTVIGSRDGHIVMLEQHSIINFSSRGTPFHQFPARIYVDGRILSEAQYRQLFGITGRGSRRSR